MPRGFGLDSNKVSAGVVTVVSPTNGSPVQLRPDQKTVICNVPSSSAAILYLPPPQEMPGEIITIEVGLDGGNEVEILWYEGEDATRTPEETGGSQLTDKLGAVDDYVVLLATALRWVVLAEQTS